MLDFARELIKPEDRRCQDCKAKEYREQGYAKAIDDVKKMLNKQKRDCLIDLDSYNFNNLIKCLTKLLKEKTK